MYDYLDNNSLIKDPFTKLNQNNTAPKIAKVVLNDIAKDPKYVKFFTNPNNLNLDAELDYEEPLTKKQKKRIKQKQKFQESRRKES